MGHVLAQVGRRGAAQVIEARVGGVARAEDAARRAYVGVDGHG
jgi:hypothetical protein